MSPTDKTAEPAPDFNRSVAAALANDRLRRIFDQTTRLKTESRQTAMAAEFADTMAIRLLAARIKDHTLQNLDRYLEQFVGNVRRRGGHVHFAATGEDACRIITDIARDAKAQRIVKSKSMVSEEIELNPELERAGLEVMETDLGEYILQLAGEKPSHIVTPVMHKGREEVGQLFAEKLGVDYTPDPEKLTKVARRVLREKFRAADLGIIGANCAVAETGTVAIVTNEGNGRFCASRPRVLVCLMGIEKVIPRMRDLPVFVKLLGKSATGQRVTCYTSLITGPKRPGDFDGPEEFHFVLLDNGRTRILGGEYRQTLRCIRCGACLNICPVYRKIGGHAYEATYPGPIGSVISPLLKSLATYESLPLASSLCHACLEACPVRIDIPTMLIHLRNDLLKLGRAPLMWRIGFKFWKMGMHSKVLYHWGAKMGRWYLSLKARNGWIRKLPADGKAWTDHRDLPNLAKRPFHQRWGKLKAELDAQEKR